MLPIRMLFYVIEHFFGPQQLELPAEVLTPHAPALIAKLEDPVENLVRKDAQFKKLELVEDDYVGNADKVVEVLLAYPKLLQRPVIVTADKAIIGRPLGDQKATERLNDLFS